MPSKQNAQKPLFDKDTQRRTLRIKQADRFEILAAASEAEDICPIWITDRLSERQQVSS